MKNLLPITKVPFPKERGLSDNTTENSRLSFENQTPRGFSRVLLSQFLNRLTAIEESPVDFSDSRSGPIDEQTIRRVAYFRYLERLEKGINISAEDDWRYAEETLKKQNRGGAV